MQHYAYNLINKQAMCILLDKHAYSVHFFYKQARTVHITLKTCMNYALLFDKQASNDKQTSTVDFT